MGEAGAVEEAVVVVRWRYHLMKSNSKRPREANPAANEDRATADSHTQSNLQCALLTRNSPKKKTKN